MNPPNEWGFESSPDQLHPPSLRVAVSHAWALVAHKASEVLLRDNKDIVVCVKRHQLLIQTERSLSKKC